MQVRGFGARAKMPDPSGGRIPHFALNFFSLSTPFQSRKPYLMELFDVERLVHAMKTVLGIIVSLEINRIRVKFDVAHSFLDKFSDRHSFGQGNILVKAGAFDDDSNSLLIKGKSSAD